MPTREEIVQYLSSLPDIDYSDVLLEVDSGRRRNLEEELEADVLPQNADRDTVAAWLARKHLAIDPGIVEVFYLQIAPPREIRLVEVNQLVNLPDPADNVIPALDFGLPIEGLHYSLFVADLTPGQMEALRRGQLRLPQGWVLEPFRRFGRHQP